MTAPNAGTLLSNRDAIGSEINRLTQLLGSIEDPGPFYLPGQYQERWDGGARITAASAQDAAAQGFGWPVTVPNKDYIADPVRREQTALALQEQIAALRTQLAATVTQILSQAGSDGVVRVGNVPGSAVQEFLPAPPVQGPVPSSVTAQLQAGLPLDALTSSAPPVNVNLPSASLAGSTRPLGGEPLVSIQEDFGGGAGSGRATAVPTSDDEKQALLGAALVAVLAYLLLSGD